MGTKKVDFTIQNLGEAKIPSPIAMSLNRGDGRADYVDDNDRIIYTLDRRIVKGKVEGEEEDLLEVAGPRQKIYFNPSKYIAMQMYGAIILPLGDGDGQGTVVKFSSDDEYLFDMGAELMFSF